VAITGYFGTHGNKTRERAVEKGEDSSDKQTEEPARVLTTKDRTDFF
jgi:hypothetical protein